MTVSDGQDSGKNTLNRRLLLKSLGVGSVAGLAGCLGDDDDADDTAPTDDGDDDGTAPGDDDDGTGEQQLGERVPTIVIEYWTGGGGASQQLEDTAPILQESIEQLGVDVEVQATGLSQHAAEIGEDQRTHHLSLWPQITSPSSQDWNRIVRVMAADNAGAHNAFNDANYADCDFTHPAILQQWAPTVESRDALGFEAMGIVSRQHILQPVVHTLEWTAVNDAAVDLDGLGERGISETHMWPFIKSRPTQGDALRTNIGTASAETTNHMVLGDVASRLYPWHTMINATLIGNDENNDQVNLLAENFETSDGGRTITVELRDAEFSNGDPITADDVKFTYEYVFNNTGELRTQFTTPEPWSIEVVDDRTTEFTFDRPFLPLVSWVWRNWAILHEESWLEGGADGDPAEVNRDTLVHSGPFRVRNFESGELIHLEPNPGWPLDGPDHELVLQVHRDDQTAFQALQSGALDIMTRLSAGGVQQARNDDQLSVHLGGGTRPLGTRVQYPSVPVKFQAVRQAISMTYDRQRVNQLLHFGEPDVTECLHSGNWLPAHPMYDEDVLERITDDPSGDVDGARDVLQQAGFGWDDDGHLRFPEGADLEPLWPRGEHPTGPDGPNSRDGMWPCLDAEGNYAGEPEDFEYPTG